MPPRKPPKFTELRRSHTPEAIRGRLQDGPAHSYLRDFVYGAIDGTVTTFAVVSGVAGARLSSDIVVILGLANLVGDGFSMAAGNFLATRAEVEQRRRARNAEEDHIEHFPEGEREEIRQIFAAKGFRGAELEHVVEVITADRARWVDTMLREEHGFSNRAASPLRAALSTLAAFAGVGLLPLAPFLAGAGGLPGPAHPYVWSAVVTVLAFFVVGALKGRVLEQRWHASGAETLLVGGCAAALAYLVGVFLRGIVTVV